MTGTIEPSPKGNARSVWLWADPPDSTRLPFAYFDYTASKIQSYEIVSCERLEQESPADIVVTLTRRKAESLDGLHYLPNVVRCPLIDDTLRKIVVRFAGDDVQFMPVTVRAKDGEVTRYAYARPLYKAPCVDLDRSAITDWIVPNDAILFAPRVVFRPDCLDGRHIVRDSNTSRVLASDALKAALMATGDKGLRFTPPIIENY